MGHYNRLSQAIQGQLDRLKWDGREVDTGHWQGYETQGRPDLITDELINVSFDAPIPHSMHVLEDECRPNMPWAEMEFQERVAGHANNPHHSLEYWPYWSGGAQAAATHAGGENFQFTHTYSERFWPNYTGEDPVGKIRGIRYQWGDLDDVLDLLQGHPYTRQATFPIFFPEDTVQYMADVSLAPSIITFSFEMVDFMFGIRYVAVMQYGTFATTYTWLADWVSGSSTGFRISRRRTGPNS